MNHYKMAVVFDLDDTLFHERHFLYSAYRQLCLKYAPIYKLKADSLYSMMLTADNAFDSLFLKLQSTDSSLIPPTPIEMRDFYRYHYPDITLTPTTQITLRALATNHEIALGLITDGRSITQRRKIEALKLNNFFPNDRILISEETGYDKLSGRPFEIMKDLINADRYLYIGDNPVKDIEPAKLCGWTTILLRDTEGLNIHPQPSIPSPDIMITGLSQLLPIIKDFFTNHTSAPTHIQ